MEREFEIKVVIDLPVEAWIEDARGGAPESLGQALEAWRPYLARMAANELAPELRPKGDVSDLVQETFLKAARDFGKFTGRTAPEWQSWLRTIFLHTLKHLARTYRSTAKRMLVREVPLDLVQGAEFGDRSLTLDVSSPSSVAMKKELGEVVQGAVNRLSERERLLLLMRFREQCTFEEMGRRFGYSPTAAKKAFDKAVSRVRAEVGPSSSSMAG